MIARTPGLVVPRLRDYRGANPVSLTSRGLQKFDHLGETRHFSSMSAQEIIAELSKLRPDELQRVKEKLHELETISQREPRTRWGHALLEIAGTADDLPADLSVNHDHYLYGTPKRQ